MSTKNRVLRSINNEDESRCVDIFLRADNTFGFEEFRRDTEDIQGWFPVGFFSSQIFDNKKRTLDEALIKVAWLREIMAKDLNGKT